jgi:hypothetical protein
MGVLLTERSGADKRRDAFSGGNVPVFPDCRSAARIPLCRMRRQSADIDAENPAARPRSADRRAGLAASGHAEIIIPFVSNCLFDDGAFLQQQKARTPNCQVFD